MLVVGPAVDVELLLPLWVLHQVAEVWVLDVGEQSWEAYALLQTRIPPLDNGARDQGRVVLEEERVELVACARQPEDVAGPDKGENMDQYVEGQCQEAVLLARRLLALLLPAPTLASLREDGETAVPGNSFAA